jgi:hypothetical protein
MGLQEAVGTAPLPAVVLDELAEFDSFELHCLETGEGGGRGCELQEVGKEVAECVCRYAD